MKDVAVSRLVVTGLLFATTGCIGSDSHDDTTKKQGAVDPITVVGVVLSVTAAIYDHAGTEATVDERLSSLESAVAQLGQQVADLSWVERRDAVLGMNRDMAIIRGDLSSALFNIRETPSMWSGPETTAMAAADGLVSDSFYYFPGPTAGSPDRFDPRATVPTFMEAVDTWLTVRATAGLDMTDAARAKLQGYAATLVTNAQRTLAAVSCYRRRYTFIENNGDGTRTTTCVRDLLCDDFISVQSWVTDETDRVGGCGFVSTLSPTDSANAASKYDPAEMIQIASIWQQF